jgi:hypothetical protein
LEKKKKYRLKFIFQEIDLAPGTFLIGRSPSCNLTLEDPLVSRQHVKIVINDKEATIEDMGSRNGTLVNNEPLFDASPLKHKDRVRVGSHEMVFLVENRFPSRPMRPTGAMISCPACQVAMAAGTLRCPHCDTEIGTGNLCRKCRTPTKIGDVRCGGCGAPLSSKDDTTIPIVLGGASSGWTSSLVVEVIEKAIAAGKFRHAANLLDGKIEDFDFKISAGTLDVALLLEISGFNTTLARELKQPERNEWIIKSWTSSASPMPLDLLDKILESKVEGSIISSIEEYLTVLKSTGDTAHSRQTLVSRLEDIIHGNDR